MILRKMRKTAMFTLNMGCTIYCVKHLNKSLTKKANNDDLCWWDLCFNIVILTKVIVMT